MVGNLCSITPDSSTESMKDMRTRYKAVLAGSRLSTDLLHIITITQEAFLIFAIETIRFKPASVIKINKLGGVCPESHSLTALLLMWRQSWCKA